MLILAAIDATRLCLILIVQTSKRLTPCHAEQETRLSRDSTRISFYTERMGGRENE